jgi:ABC-type sugar transport system permease subunit
MPRVVDFIRKYRVELVMLLPVFLYLLGFLIIIFFYIISLSLTYMAPDFSEQFPSLRNFSDIFSASEFRNAFINTLLFVFIGTPLELIAGLVLALLIYRNFRFRGLVRSIFIIPLAVPAIVTAIILYVLSDYPTGHVNSLLMGQYSIFPRVLDAPINWRSTAFFSLGISLLGKVWRDMPISMLILLAGLNSITEDQYKAAETMGANERQKFRFITIPLLLPAISTVLIIRSIEMWKEFIFPYFLARRYHLFGTYIEYLYHDCQSSGRAAAVSIFLVLSILSFSAFLFWFLKKMRGALIRI